MRKASKRNASAAAAMSNAVEFAFGASPLDSSAASQRSRRLLSSVLDMAREDGSPVVLGDSRAELLGESHDDPHMTDGELARFQLALRGFLASLAQARHGGLVPTVRVGPVDYSAVTVKSDSKGARSATLVTVDGRAIDVLWLQILEGIRRVGSDHVRICIAPDCETVFVKPGKKQYCSDRCQKRVYMRVTRLAPRQPRRRGHGTTRTR